MHLGEGRLRSGRQLDGPLFLFEFGQLLSRIQAILDLLVACNPAVPHHDLAQEHLGEIRHVRAHRQLLVGATVDVVEHTGLQDKEGPIDPPFHCLGLLGELGHLIPLKHEMTEARGRPDCRQRGEFAMLGRSFNNMVETLTDTQEELLRKDKLASVGQLAAGVAHELNNPLGTILLYSDAMLTDAPPAAAAVVAAAAHSQPSGRIGPGSVED